MGVLRELSCPLSSAGSSQSCPVARGPPGEPTWERSEVGESHCHTYSGSPQKPRGSTSSRDPLSFFCHQEKSLAPAFSVLKMTRRGGGGSGLGTSAREGTWGGGRASLAWRCVQGYLPRSGNASAGPETLELAPHGLCSRHPENCVFRRIRWRRIKQCPCGRESQSGCCPSLGTSGEVSVVRPVGPALGTDPRMFPEGQAAGGRVRIPGLPPGRWELVGNVPKWAQVVLLEGPTGRGPPTATEHEVHSDLAACLTAPQGCPALLLYTDRSPACRPCDALPGLLGVLPPPHGPCTDPLLLVPLEILDSSGPSRHKRNPQKHFLVSGQMESGDSFIPFWALCSALCTAAKAAHGHHARTRGLWPERAAAAAAGGKSRESPPRPPHPEAASLGLVGEVPSGLLFPAAGRGLPPRRPRVPQLAG